MNNERLDEIFEQLIQEYTTKQRDIMRRNGPQNKEDNHHGKINLLSIQEIVASISTSELHEDWIEKFKTKYEIT